MHDDFEIENSHEDDDDDQEESYGRGYTNPTRSSYNSVDISQNRNRISTTSVNRRSVGFNDDDDEDVYNFEYDNKKSGKPSGKITVLLL
jgi:hypothetical protein